MKLRTLLALACAMILSLSAVGMVLATDQTCGETEQGTTTCPSDGATPTPTATTETSSPSDESSPSDGGVAAETGTPSVTLPPTDSLSGGSGNGSGGVPIAILAMAGLLAAVLLMTPATAGLKRGKRK